MKTYYHIVGMKSICFYCLTIILRLQELFRPLCVYVVKGIRETRKWKIYCNHANTHTSNLSADCLRCNSKSDIDTDSANETTVFYFSKIDMKREKVYAFTNLCRTPFRNWLLTVFFVICCLCQRIFSCAASCPAAESAAVFPVHWIFRFFFR